MFWWLLLFLRLRLRLRLRLVFRVSYYALCVSCDALRVVRYACRVCRALRDSGTICYPNVSALPVALASNCLRCSDLREPHPALGAETAAG